MTELNNIELDLLFRIDFFALTNFGEDGYTGDDKFEVEKNALKNSYGFSRYVQREIKGYEYVRHSDLVRDTQPYINYLKMLDEKDLFECCQLEQAIGLFQNGNLMAFLSTDTGLCYNLQAHFDSVAGLVENGESDLDDVNTFYGKVVGNTIELFYSPKSNNIDIKKTEGIIEMSINRNDFELELSNFRNRVNEFFGDLRSKLKFELSSQENKDFVDDVFREIKTKA